MKHVKKLLHLALHGGGVHGAFTWGVLDTLLADGRLAPAGISGASAGAVNAVALAHGWAQALDAGRDPLEGARATLDRVWNQVMALGAISEGAAQIVRLMLGALPGALAENLSPYQTSRLDYNPLRRLIEQEIDFDRLARLEWPRVFVAATDVETGHAEIFSGQRLNAQAVLASCCLPHLFHAPEIDGRLYWDGGYSANPALGPLVEMEQPGDILLVQVNPLKPAGPLNSMTEIAERMNDVTFTASLIAQMRVIALINGLIDRGLTHPGLRPIRMHRIDGGQALAELPAHHQLLPQPDTLKQLFAIGRDSARHWLEHSLDAVGQRSSIDLHRDYGEPPRFGFSNGLAPAHHAWPDRQRVGV